MLKFIEESRFSNVGDILVTSKGVAFFSDERLFIDNGQSRIEIILPPDLQLGFLGERGKYIELVSNYEELFYIDSKLNKLVKTMQNPFEEGHGLYNHYLNVDNISIYVLRKKRHFKIIMYNYLSKEVIYVIENLIELNVLYVDEERIIFSSKENEGFIIKCFKLNENKLLWSFELSQYFNDRFDMSSYVTVYKENIIFSINGSHTLSFSIATGRLIWISENATDLIDIADGKAYKFSWGFIRILDCDTGELIHYQENWFDTDLYKDSYGLTSNTACFYENYIILFSAKAEIFIIDKKLNTIVDSLKPPFKGRESFRRPLMMYKNYLFLMDSSPSIYKYRIEMV